MIPLSPPALWVGLWCNKDSFRQDFSSSGKKKGLSLEAKRSVFKIYTVHNVFVLNLKIRQILGAPSPSVSKHIPSSSADYSATAALAGASTI